MNIGEAENRKVINKTVVELSIKTISVEQKTKIKEKKKIYIYNIQEIENIFRVSIEF